MYTRSRVATSGSNENHKVTNNRQWLCLLHYNFCKPTFTLKTKIKSFLAKLPILMLTQLQDTQIKHTSSLILSGQYIISTLNILAK